MKRNWLEMTCIGLLSLILNSLTDSRSTAQDSDAGGLEIVNLTGQLEAIVGNQLKIVGDDKSANLILIGDESTFSYSGTADPSVLSPGLLVRFTADFDLAGSPQAPLAELEIFRPVQGRRLPLEVRQSQTPGVYPVDPPGPADAAPKNGVVKAPPANKSQQGNKAKPPVAADNQTANNAAPAAVQTFRVVGILRAVQGDRLQVVAGNQPLILQASPEMKITVSAGDATFCQPGDQVKLNALKLPNGIIQADTIIVTGAKPIGSVDPKDIARNNRADNRDKPNDKPGNSKGQAGHKQPIGKPPRGK
ncbi:MAG: hypothetical protein ABI557_16130 [Aureliella sp.]